ncbi:2Fe-2S iron-sulfur cluster-binding protein [Kitasatospora sp. NPDC052896]|uniref:(2Fe-2S)-binding protein n=1 Tax=Kitasatospora sp. NPDC052896 TaxID=3364061 RepID=UPI0037C5C9DB
MTADLTPGIASDPLNPPPLPGEGRPCASYTLRVNGFERSVTDAWIGESLLYVLRERLGLAGAKNGCEQGECGACSVQVDGQLVAGCLVPAALAADSEISTVEGLSAGGAASDVQQALADSGAVQCGYCTPGMAMAVHDLLQRNHRPSEVEARQALCGNLCRCTGYRSALAAVQTVAQARGAALLEAEETAVEATEDAAEAVAEPTEQAEPAAEPADLPVYQEDWPPAGATAARPVFDDESGWISAELPEPAAEYAPQPTAAGTGVGAIPVQGYPGYDPTAYGPGTVYDAGTSYEPVPAHDNTAPGGSYETPAHDALYEPTPPHGTPYDPAAGHGTVYQQTPAHGTPFDPSAVNGPVYQGDPYPDQGYPAPSYPGPLYDGTPAHGIPAAPYDGTVYETGSPTVSLDPSLAPGLLPQPSAGGAPLPEDDHA